MESIVLTDLCYCLATPRARIIIARMFEKRVDDIFELEEKD